MEISLISFNFLFACLHLDYCKLTYNHGIISVGIPRLSNDYLSCLVGTCLNFSLLYLNPLKNSGFKYINCA